MTSRIIPPGTKNHITDDVRAIWDIVANHSDNVELNLALMHSTLITYLAHSFVDDVPMEKIKDFTDEYFEALKIEAPKIIEQGRTKRQKEK